jgi:hypothetical protein
MLILIIGAQTPSQFPAASAATSPVLRLRRIPITIHLQFQRIRVIDVVTAVITAKGESIMTSTPETGTATAEERKATKKARAGARGAHVAPAKAKSAKKAKATKKTPKAAKEAGAAKEGSKTAKIIDLLKRPDGATLAEVMKAAGWQAHSVRGFISGTLTKKMGLTDLSTKGETGERSYSIKA